METATLPLPQHLPISLTSCIGRAREAAEVGRLLDTSRLVTLTGVGGVGKTRLALEVAAAALPRYADGARFVDLAPATDPALIPQLTAAACGVREEPGRPLLATLANALLAQHVLLVLDNCEHLVEACAALAGTLLQSSPHVRILATSREALGVAGEIVWPVSPLPVEPPGAADTAAMAPARDSSAQDAAGAVELFVERARAVSPGFALAPGDWAVVAEICRRLDGLPLAIELAAARTRALTLPELLRRLDDRYRLLTGSSRTGPPHQHTLRAAMDWSHDLLAEPERVLFRRLSVFAGGAGGFTLEAAEAVCAEEDERRRTNGESSSPAAIRPSSFVLGRDDVLDLLGRLVDKSLVAIAVPAGAGRSTRYGLLETVREYGAEKLRAAGEHEEFLRRHALYYLSVAEAGAPALTGPSQASWMERLDAEHDNLRKALRWAVEGGDAAVGLRLGGALWRYWQARGHFSEGQRWLEAALARGDDAPARDRAAALTAAGNLALARGAPAEARRLHEANLGVWRTIGDQAGIAAALRNLGLVAVDQGDRAAARARFEESLAIERELGDRWRIALALHCLGALARDEGDLDCAQSRSEESLALFRALGDTRTAGLVLMTLGSVALDRGDLARARARNQESLESYRALGDRRGVAIALNQLAKVAYAESEDAQAAALCADSLTQSNTLGLTRVAVSCVEVLAATAHRLSHDVVAARLLGAASALRRAAGTVLPPAEQRLYDGVLDTLRARLGEPAFSAAWTSGQAMPADQATALALEVAEAARGSAGA
jgi:non-specific serine/threonine protein kinase